MDIVGNLLKFLKSLNFKYEKNEDNHSFDLNIKEETTNLEGSFRMKVNKDKQSEISAKLGKNKGE